MEPYCVLICDDNEAVHISLTSYLQSDQFQVISAYSGRDALEQMNNRQVDAVVLDLMLGDMDGLDVLKEIRKIDENIYILILSAKEDELDRVVGLELGADDYVGKPFSPREVAIRVKNAMKRVHSSVSPTTLTLAELTVLPEQYKVYVADREVKLSAREINVLALMLNHVSKVVTREQLLNVAWGYDYLGDTRVVDTMIKRLRQKICTDGIHFQITNVYGIGYKIEEIP